MPCPGCASRAEPIFFCKVGVLFPKLELPDVFAYMVGPAARDHAHQDGRAEDAQIVVVYLSCPVVRVYGRIHAESFPARLKKASLSLSAAGS